ncbi:pullulanase-type alpha-1,6-glucosidase [Propioniciclava soli]|uniref:pullulanase-type alpha-1,6-glucosidase n=1 Tax=Propioniciclava soli TaxID=2775081 RepID=UPI001E282BF8|nr:pullulanase-type alpha-1,6-glucosidase [Propioniciclava soli]
MLELTLARGIWLTPDLLAWPPCALGEHAASALDWALHAAPEGGIDPRAAEPVAWQTFPLAVEPALPDDIVAQHPHLARAVALWLPPGVDAAETLRGQVVVAAHDASGTLVEASGVQNGPVLDRLYPEAVHARLGLRWDAGVPSLRVWAPTARQVDVLLWPSGAASTDAPRRLAMAPASDGTWSITGAPDWAEARYQYAVTVFAPTFGRVVENRVTDPYSVALTVNSTRSVIADLDDPALRPPVWEDTPSPLLGHAVDQVAYELHVRDFSRSDELIAPELRGTYAAFTEDGHGRRHLARLAAAGLNTVQLLPIFDYASVEEDAARQVHPDPSALRSAAPDSEGPQGVVRTPRRSFNWGYDPWHYQVPEGSLATAGAVDGAGRTREVRAMIGALHGLGLRVVLDQVYNHTDGSGQGATSVLGRLVPGYYHRHDRDGEVSHSTCCPGVATEHAIAEKLMVESVVHWVRAYRVDGFRFDLMGHHSRATMERVRAALDALTPDADGVDGRAVTLYGEGWNFGEVADNARFVQATQGQLGGTGIGTFSDRLRDAVRGGAPFDDDPRVQGFGTGLVTAPNGAAVNGDAGVRGQQLLRDADLVQLGLAGTLRAFRFRSQETGEVVRGDQLAYRGQPAGYADEPDEVISYVDAHDNETLFDAITMKLPPDVPMAQRVRVNTVCLALATLGQSPVMWHAGSDFLRSKSLDRNSFDSGDWFNHLDFALANNGFGAGLPPASDNAAHWRFMRPLLADPALKPDAAAMLAAHEAACDLLRIRASSSLFRLRTAAQIDAKVSFPVSGTWAQTSGVVVMLLDDRRGTGVDARWDAIAVAVNANAWPVHQEVPAMRAGGWALHPAHEAGADAVVRRARCDDGVLALPAWTCAVFVHPR